MVFINKNICRSNLKSPLASFDKGGAVNMSKPGAGGFFSPSFVHAGFISCKHANFNHRVEHAARITSFVKEG
jgi:hypothetical protein